MTRSELKREYSELNEMKRKQNKWKIMIRS